MPPGGGDHGRTEHHHPPASGRDDDAPPHPQPLFPAPTEEAFEISKKKKLEEEEEYLPENALFEILSRVPYKSLCRFRRFHLETGRWTAMQNKLAQEIVLLREPPCVFLNGIMYLSSLDCRIIMVDIERKTWREIEWLVDMAHRTEIVTIGQSLGILHAWLTYKDNGSSQVQLYVWVLEDIASRRWTLKHTATNILELFGRECYNDEESFRAFAIHPDRNLIYITDYG